jgi:hypothetical protein
MGACPDTRTDHDWRSRTGRGCGGRLGTRQAHPADTLVQDHKTPLQAEVTPRPRPLVGVLAFVPLAGFEPAADRLEGGRSVR